MNPTAQGLDPKLKETYDRIMGTEFAPKNEATPANPQPSQPVSEPAPDTHVYVADSKESSAPQTFVNKNRKIPPFVFVALGVIFFGVYTLIWLKVFNIF